MINLVKTLIRKRAWLKQIVKDACDGVVRGNLYNSYPSHYHREVMAKVAEFDLQEGISGAVYRFAKIRSGNDKTSIFPDYYDISFMCFLIDYFESRSVLEFGSGCSTAGISRKVENSKGSITFVSIEAEEYWSDINNKALVSTFSESIPRIIWCPAVVENYDGVATYIHNGIPEGRYDFVYLDGPELKEATSALDVLKKNMGHDQLVILIDGRDKNSELLYNKLVTVNPNWKRFAFKYPSNDTLIINKKNQHYLEFEKDFGPILISC